MKLAIELLSCQFLSYCSPCFNHLQSITRGAASQIFSEEVLASCSGGPRGNEQLRVYIFSFDSFYLLTQNQNFIN